jgi:hypothetical protein
MNKNMLKLTELLDTDDDLIAEMMATECLSPRQLGDLREEPKRRNRNKKLLDMLKRRSQDHLKQFISCLEKTQRHLVPYFTGDAGRV